jgi:hypothetical protein
MYDDSRHLVFKQGLLVCRDLVDEGLDVTPLIVAALLRLFVVRR